MRHRRRAAGILLLALAVLGIAGLEFALARLGVRATVLPRRNPPAEEDEQRRVRDPRDDVAEIYGVPVGGADLEVVLVDEDRFVTPREAPDRRLLAVAPGEAPPLQARTVRYAGRAAAAVLAVAGALLGAWPRRRPDAVSCPPPTPPPSLA
jgi:hypothetical protein